MGHVLSCNGVERVTEVKWNTGELADLLHLMIPNFRLMPSKASSIKKGSYACQLLDNDDMYKYTKYKYNNQNIPCDSRVISVFATC